MLLGCLLPVRLLTVVREVLLHPALTANGVPLGNPWPDRLFAIVREVSLHPGLSALGARIGRGSPCSLLVMILEIRFHPTIAPLKSSVGQPGISVGCGVSEQSALNQLLWIFESGGVAFGGGKVLAREPEVFVSHDGYNLSTQVVAEPIFRPEQSPT